MSLQSGIDTTNNDPDYRGKFFPDLIPFNHPLAQQGLGSVLAVNNSAFIPNTTTKQDATDFDTLGCVKIETGTVGMGNQPALVIGEAGDILQIKGATLLGSLLVGNGANTEGLPVGANGLVLKANSGAPLGVEWGTDASGGTVMAVNAGDNINITGTIAQPIVAFQSPTTSDIVLGTATKIVAKDNYATPNFTTEIDSTGFNDTYSQGGVVNQEDIAVSATNVIQTLSATDGSTYQNSAIVNCGTSTISDQKLTTNLTTTQEGSAGITCGSTLVSMGVGCGFPSGANGSVGLQATDTNPLIALSQSAPFSASYSTIIDKDGIIQNNSGGVGFTIQTNSSDFNIQNTANVGIFPNNNTTIASVGTTFLNGNLIKCVKTGAGGQANPQLILENQNATGSVATEIYKNKPTAGALGDVLHLQSVYGKDSTNAKQEYTRITHAIRDPTNASEDGSIEFACIRAGSINTFLQLNGVENEVNCLKNLDMTGNNIITNTGDMTISTTASVGTGNLDVITKGVCDIIANGGASITGGTGLTASGATFTSGITLSSNSADISMTAKQFDLTTQPTAPATAFAALYLDNTGGVEINCDSTLTFTGAGLQSATAGGNSGQHLVITLNGVQYKIKLENP